MQSKNPTGLNDQLTPSAIYGYIMGKKDFKVSEKTFTSNSRFEEREISSPETYNTSDEDFDVVENNGTTKALKIPYYVQKDNIIITTPAHDSRNDNIATEAQKIDEALANVKDNLVNDRKILMPICQENKTLRLFRKGHFTMLEISKDNNGNVSAVHHDSQGFFSKILYALGLYSLAPIQEAVQKAFPGATFDWKCHGHQNDRYNCGRFVIGYINQKIAGEEISDPSDKFQEIQNKINEPEQSKQNPVIAQDTATSNLDNYVNNQQKSFKRFVQNQQQQSGGHNL